MKNTTMNALCIPSNADLITEKPRLKTIMQDLSLSNEVNTFRTCVLGDMYVLGGCAGSGALLLEAAPLSRTA